jgi:hypothetical protein
MGNPLVSSPSRSWSIIQMLAMQLATITVANGYLTDVGLNIWTTDHQRPNTAALGLMIYSEPIVGMGLDNERPTKPVRHFSMLLECTIGTDIDTAQQDIHSLIEDIENCMTKWSVGYLQAARLTGPMHVADIAILDRPEGEPVVAMQARIIARYFR